MSSAHWVGLPEVSRVLGNRSDASKWRPSAHRVSCSSPFYSGPPQPRPQRRPSLPRTRPPLREPQTWLRPARTRLVWFSPSSLFLEFLPLPSWISGALHLRPAAERVEGPGPCAAAEVREDDKRRGLGNAEHARAGT